jgi:hypothetical protein
MPSQTAPAERTWADAQAQVEQALRALPIKGPVRSDRIPYSFVIPDVARQILLIRWSNNLKRGRGNEIAALDRISKTARRLIDLIDDQMEPPAPSSPEFRIWTLLTAQDVAQVATLRDSLKAFITAAQQARDKSSKKPRRGRPEKAIAAAICRYLYQEHERLTGKLPTRIVKEGKSGGEFQVLIQRVFEALDLKASPEAAAMKAMEEMKGSAEI